MKTCASCKEKVLLEEGRMDDAGKFLCLECANELKEEDDRSLCPECGETSEEFGEERTCPSCGYEAEDKETDDEDKEKEDA